MKIVLITEFEASFKTILEHKSVNLNMHVVRKRAWSYRIQYRINSQAHILTLAFESLWSYWILSLQPISVLTANVSVWINSTLTCLPSKYLNTYFLLRISLKVLKVCFYTDFRIVMLGHLRRTSYFFLHMFVWV